MPLQITGRRCDVSKSDRYYIEKKIVRVRRLLDQIDEMVVTFEAGKREYIVEVTVRAGTLHAVSKGVDGTSRSAIDKAIDKVVAQINRAKDKRSGNKMHSPESIRVPAEEEDIEDEGEGDDEEGAA